DRTAEVMDFRAESLRTIFGAEPPANPVRASSSSGCPCAVTFLLLVPHSMYPGNRYSTESPTVLPNTVRVLIARLLDAWVDRSNRTAAESSFQTLPDLFIRKVTSET